jgi:hypothetical protein
MQPPQPERLPQLLRSFAMTGFLRGEFDQVSEIISPSEKFSLIPVPAEWMQVVLSVSGDMSG